VRVDQPVAARVPEPATWGRCSMRHRAGARNTEPPTGSWGGHVRPTVGQRLGGTGHAAFNTIFSQLSSLSLKIL
jgi:hypothetical protein